MNRFGKGPVVVGLLVLGLLVVAMATRPWVLAETASVAGGDVAQTIGRRELAATGTRLGPASALGLVVMAAAGAMLLAARTIVTVLGVVALVAAGGAAWNALRVLLDPVTAVLPVAAEGTGLTAGSLDPAEVEASVTGWAVAGLVVGLAAVLVAVVAVTTGRRWGASRRFELDDAASAAPAGSAAHRPAIGPGDVAADDWDALSRGEDPTTRSGPSGLA